MRLLARFICHPNAHRPGADRMKTLLRSLNYASCWRGYQRVSGQDVFHPSFDRWLYLTLHRWGWMGVLERAVINRFVHPGMHVLDVGANLGLYTIYFCQQVGKTGKVTSLEP